MLPDIAHAPRILPNFSQHIPGPFKKVYSYIIACEIIKLNAKMCHLQDLDNYIRTRAPVTFLQELRGQLTVS